MNLKVIAGLTIVAIFFIAFSVKQCQRANRNAEEREQAINHSLVTEKQNKWYKNKLDRETVKAEATALSLRNAKKLLETEKLKFVKQFKGVKKNVRNVETVIAVTAKAEKEIKLIGQDSSGIKRHVDAFNDFSIALTNDTVTLKYTIIVPIEGVIFWRRKRILGLRIGKKLYEVHMTSSNPNVHLSNLSTIRFVRRR